jgi:hypothetical protein
MVAVLDSKRKSFFVIENTNVKTGAKAISLHALSPCSEDAQINYSKFDLDDKRYTWLVCPHLAGSDRVYEYYMSSGWNDPLKLHKSEQADQSVLRGAGG